jgi:hypothetical protein
MTAETAEILTRRQRLTFRDSARAVKDVFLSVTNDGNPNNAIDVKRYSVQEDRVD